MIKWFVSEIREDSVFIKLTGASCYKVNQFLLVDLIFIGFNISVARVGRTGAWDNDPVN